MNRRICFSLSALLIASLLSACGGGGSKTATVPQAANPKNTSAPARYANVAVNVMSPSAQSQSSQRRAKYISPATNSMTIAVNSGQPTTVALATSSPNCSLNPTGNLICTATVSAPEGPSDSFTITLFSGNNATGVALSTATVVQAVTAGTNDLNVTLNGIVASINLALQNTSLNAGATGTTTLAVNALDASGNTIVGPGGFSDANGNALTVNIATTQTTPTIQTGFTAGATTLATTSVTGPGSPLSVSYNGYALLSTLFTATVTGGATIAPASATLSLTPTVYEYALPASSNPYHMAVGPDKQIWVALFGVPGLYHFVPVPPGQATLNGTQLTTPQGNLGVTAGADGNIWFDDWNFAVYKVPPTGTSAQISTYTTPYNKPNNLVDGGDGNMYVAYSYFYGPNYIPENTPPGAYTPIGTNFGGGDNIVVGSDQRVWSGDGQLGCCYLPYVQGIPTGISANQTTSTFNFGGSLPGAGITWVAAGADGNIWYTIRDGNIVGHISPSASSVSQAVSIQMAAGTLPFHLIAGPDGYMYIAEHGVNKIGRMPVTATTGNLGLTEYLAPGASNDFNAIITGPDGNIWFDEASAPNVGKLAL